MQYLFLYGRGLYGVWQCRKIVREEESRGGRAVVVAKRGDGTTARAVSPMGMYIPVIYTHITIETPYLTSIRWIYIKRVNETIALLKSLISPYFVLSISLTKSVSGRCIEMSPSFPYSVENYVLLRLINKPRKRTGIQYAVFDGQSGGRRGSQYMRITRLQYGVR